MGQPGSVAYLFHQLGKIVVEKNGKILDEIFLKAADAGAEDVQDGEESKQSFIPHLPV